jgi:hypothetical protein
VGIGHKKSGSESAFFMVLQAQHQDRPTPLLIRLSTKSTRNTKNRILAIPAAPAAIPPKPSTPAMMATIKNITVHFSMIDKNLNDLNLLMYMHLFLPNVCQKCDGPLHA